jgi:hypothetical protein
MAGAKLRNCTSCTHVAKAFHFRFEDANRLRFFRLGSIVNLAYSTPEVGGAEVDVGMPPLPDVVPPKWNY